MKKGIWWIVIIILVILVAWFFVAQDRRGAPGGSSDNGPIKIGFIGPLSGDAAAYGEPARNATELAVKQINDAGGVNGRIIEMIYEDSACAGTEGANAASKLINVDGVRILTGGICSTATLAAEPIATENGVIFIAQAASSPDLTGISPLFARTYPSDAAQGIVLAEIAYNDKGWRKIAFMQESLDYPLGIYRAFDENFSALGGETIKEEFPSEETDFRTSLSKLKAESPDALFIDPQTGAVGERILQQVFELGWDVPLILNDALSGDTETVERHKENLEGALFAEFSINAGNEKFDNLLADYEAAYGAELPYQSYGQTEFDAVGLIASAIEAVGEEPEAMMAWIKSQTDWEGASGIVLIGENGDRVGGHVPRMILNGEEVPYTTE